MIDAVAKRASEIVWSPFLLIIVLGVGIWLAFRTKFYQARKFGKVLKDVFKSKDGFGAMATALGATVGTGNIVGVAAAIALGGAGAVFWIWVGAFFGMMLKFAEASLSVRYRDKDCGGAPKYIEKVFVGRRIAVFWSLCCVASSFGTGNMVQSGAAAVMAEKAFDIPALIIGIVLAAITGSVLFFGAKGVTKTSTVLVTIMSVFYILGSFFLLFKFRNNLPAALASIFKSAFEPLAAGGGIIGFLTAESLKVGITRGTFTNEAGMGSASLAHSESEETEPSVQGSFGIIEVFLDTIVVCTLTALVILSSGITAFTEESTTEAFSLGFGNFGEKFLGISMFLFALAAMIGWAFYAEKALGYITKSKTAVLIYRAAFCVMAVVGSITELPTLWNISDTFNGLMIFPNVIAILLLSKEVIEFTKDNKKGAS